MLKYLKLNSFVVVTADSSQTVAYNSISNWRKSISNATINRSKIVVYLSNEKTYLLINERNTEAFAKFLGIY